MTWLENKYVMLMSNRLPKFKRKSNNLYNFQCPICGDSKDGRKTRGYIYERKGIYRFHCHNCNASMKFEYFMKRIDNILYYEYIKEKISQNEPVKEETKFTFVKPKFQSNGALKKIKKVSTLKPEHPAKMYIEGRRIPSDTHYKLYYAAKFKHWVNTMIPDKFDSDSLTRDEPRLVIPMLDKDGEMFGFQGRSFRKDSKLRYITIMLNEDKPKLFGLDKLDASKDIYLVEGPIDSLFLPNSLASAGSDLTSNIRNLNKEKIVVCYDNEPRNKEIVDKISRCIDNGYRVCIWPDDIKEKDINDMILAGMTQQNVVNTINNNTYTGLSAKLRFNEWKKV